MSRKTATTNVIEFATGTFPDGAFPVAERRPGRGVRGVRAEPTTDLPVFDAMAAATLCGRFPAGGAAFVVWLGKEHPTVRPDERWTMAQWEPYLTEFADRPILGHRRRTGNATHRNR